MTDHSVDDDLIHLTLTGVNFRCAQESQRFFRHQSHDPRYCYELFRRAILERNERAWELIYSQYHALVTGWVMRNPSFPASGEEAQYFVNRAFEKMWAAFTPAKFGQFTDLKSLLRYLQMCVHSVIVDFGRLAEQTAWGRELENELEDELFQTEMADGDVDVEEQAAETTDRAAFWRLLESRLQDDRERLVLEGCFVLDLKPREIYARSPGRFRDVNEIYRLKENVLARLRRDTTLRSLVTGNW